MRVGLSLNEDIPVDRQRGLARDAEAAGLASIWANDGLGRDPFLLCQIWADATSTLQLGVGIVQLLTRSAAQQAKAAATLQESSGGRFLLGLGVSQPAAMRWHGLEMARPLSATRDALELVSAITRGQTTDHDGVLSSHGFRLQISPLPPPVPLYLGAMKPKALELAGTHADGVLLSWESPEAIAAAAASVRTSASGAGREAPQIAAYVRVAVADNRDVARSALARQVALYWQYYAPHFEHQVPANAFAAASAAYEQGGVDALAAALDDDVLTALGWYGTPKDDIGAALERYETAGVEHFIVRAVPVGDPVDWLQTLLRTLG
jgi:5,10-methylenetetrahydromethanopterin reductase